MLTYFKVRRGEKRERNEDKDEEKINKKKRKTSEEESVTPYVGANDQYGLTLPKHYVLLQEIFRCTYIIMKMYEQREEVCTFGKLKCSVQQLLRKLVCN